jgi:1-acyl-sn-glycerol-3-phosphate acyltransferase
VYGKDLCPATGPLIIAANHSSYLDAPLIAVAYRHRRVRFMAKRELWGGKFLSWYLNSIGTIAVDRGSGSQDALSKAIDVVKGGGCLGIFPEGTRTKTGELGRGRSGAVIVAASTHATLLPVYIEGTLESMPTGSRKVKFHPIVVYTGEPFDLTEEQCDLNDRRMLHETAEMVMAKIASAKEKYVKAK